MSDTNGHTLGDVASFIRGITFTPEDVTLPFEKGTVVCMRTKNVQEDLDQDDLLAVPKSFVRRSEQYLTEGDLLVSSANSWNLVGKCSWVPILDYEATAGGFISILRADRKRVNPRYLYHWFSAPHTQHEVRLCGRQTTNISNLNYERCLNLPIPLPKLEEQKRIAAILDKADAIRRKRQEGIRELDSLEDSVFAFAVGTRAKTYDEWKEVPIESLAARHKGAMRTGPFGSSLLHSEFVDEGIAVLGIDNAVQNRFAWDQRRFITPAKYEEMKRYTVFPNDVIVTIMGTVGRSAVIPENIPTSITTKHIATLTLNRQIAEPEFVSQAMHRHPFIAKQMTNRGAIMNSWNLGLIKSLRLPLPPINVQREFTTTARELQEIRIKLNDSFSEANNLFNTLIQKAFTGEL